jgi:hypothetical protein
MKPLKNNPNTKNGAVEKLKTTDENCAIMKNTMNPMNAPINSTIKLSVHIDAILFCFYFYFYLLLVTAGKFFFVVVWTG